MKERRASSIARIATKYGLILGVLSSLIFATRALTGGKATGLALAITVALAIAVIVLAHREFKKTHDGMMTYPQGLGSGTFVIGGLIFV